jgi:hypothetical protein
MEDRTKIRLFAIAAALMLGMLGCIFGQDVKARSFRDESKLEYDVKRYFNIAFLTYSDGVLEQTDSVQIFIHERDSTTACMFTVCEKTDMYFAYDRMYLVSIYRRGYSTANLLVNSDVLIKEYGTFIPIYLEKKRVAKSVGVVVWDRRINDIHYYPEPLDFR